MNHIRPISCVRMAIPLAVAFLILSAPPAGASESVTVTTAWGDLERSSWSAGGHSPDCWAEWHHTIADGPTFDAIIEGWGWVPCGKFTATCSSDALAFHGAWDGVDPYGYFHYLYLDAELGCSLEIAEPIRLTITRDLPVPLVSDGHRIEITDPAGVTVTYLGSDPADTVEVDLNAGLHTIRLIVEFYHSDPQGVHRQWPYDGTVTVSWADIDVSAAASSWSAVKGLFR